MPRHTPPTHLFSLARQRPHPKQLLADAALRAADHLPRREAALLRAVYGHGRRLTEVADLTGTPAPHLRRQIRGLLRRINDPVFELVIREQAGWPALTRDIARACFLHGLTIEEASRTLEVKYHTVRQRRALIVEMSQLEARSLRLERRAG